MQSLLESAEPKALKDFFQKEMETDPDLRDRFMACFSEIGDGRSLSNYRREVEEALNLRSRKIIKCRVALAAGRAPAFRSRGSARTGMGAGACLERRDIRRQKSGGLGVQGAVGPRLEERRSPPARDGPRVVSQYDGFCFCKIEGDRNECVIQRGDSTCGLTRDVGSKSSLIRFRDMLSLRATFL